MVAVLASFWVSSVFSGVRERAKSDSFSEQIRPRTVDKKTRGEREREREKRTDLRTQQLKTGHRRSFEKRQGFRTSLLEFNQIEAQYFEPLSTMNFSQSVGRKPCDFARPPARPFDLLISCRPSVRPWEEGGATRGGSHLGPSYAALLTLLTHPSHSLALPPLSAMRMRNIIVVETD